MSVCTSCRILRLGSSFKTPKSLKAKLAAVVKRSDWRGRMFQGSICESRNQVSSF
jgi:hypothetical protein